MENKGSKFFKKGSAFLIAPALFSSFLPGTNASAVGGAIASKAASESFISKFGAGTVNFLSNHWGKLLILVGISLLVYMLLPSKGEESEGSGANTGNENDAEQDLKQTKIEKLESSSEGGSNNEDDRDDKNYEDELDDVLEVFSGEDFSKWTKKVVKDESVVYTFSSSVSGEGHSLFRLVIDKSKGKATFSSVGDGDFGVPICEIDSLKECMGNLEELGNKIFGFLTVFDKVVELCASKEIEPEVSGIDIFVKDFTFDLKPAAAKGFSLKLGTDLNDPWRLEEIQISNEGEVCLKYVDEDGHAQNYYWSCFRKDKPNDLKYFEDALSNEKKGFRGWVKKEVEDEEENFDVEEKIQECIQDIKKLGSVECQIIENAFGGGKEFLFRKQVNLESVTSSFSFSRLISKNGELNCHFGNGFARKEEEICLDSENTAKQVEEFFSKLKTYSDGIDYMVDFFKKGGIYAKTEDTHRFKFSGDVSVLYFFELGELKSTGFAKVSVGSDGCVRFHKNGDPWGYTYTKFDLFNADSVGKLKSELNKLSKNAEGKSSDDNGYFSDEED